MEHTTNENLETENGSETKETNQEQEDKVSLTREEYENLKSNEEKLKSSTKEAQKLSAIARVAKDDKEFAKIYRSDKRVAEEVAKYYGRKSADALMEELKERYGDSEITPTLNIDDVEKASTRAMEEGFAKKTLKDFLKSKKIEKGSVAEKNFTREFDEMMEGKDWTTDNVEKFTKKAWKLILEETPNLITPGSGGNKGGGGTAPKKQAQSLAEYLGMKKE